MPSDDAGRPARIRLHDGRRVVALAWWLPWSVGRAVAAGAVRRRPLADAACDGVVDGLVRLGPTYVKLGQVVASSADLFPERLVAAARRCLDAVPPVPTAAVRAVVEADLGRPVSEAFATFDDRPLSAGSVGQVHACTLPDGRRAVVKVQRPGIAPLMLSDLRVLAVVARGFERTRWGAGSGASGMVAELHRATVRELEPAFEARVQDAARRNLHAFGDNHGVTVPEVYWSHCGPRVICMERVSGTPLDRIDDLTQRGVDGREVLRAGAKAWLEGLMLHGPFHGDLHAGNLWLLDDGRACLLDFGITGELPLAWREFWKDLFYTCAFDRDFERVARAGRRVGLVPPDTPLTDAEVAAMMVGLLGSMLDDGFAGLNVGEVASGLVTMLRDAGSSVPEELVLIVKQLLYIDRFTKQLAPDYSLTTDPLVLRNVFPSEVAAWEARSA